MSSIKLVISRLWALFARIVPKGVQWIEMPDVSISHTE